MRGTVTFVVALLVTLFVWLYAAGIFPTGITISPADGETSVHPARVLHARFDRDVVGANIVVRIEGNDESLQPVGLTLDARERQIHILPGRPLDWSRDYRLCVEATFPLFDRWQVVAPLLSERRCSSFRTMDRPPLKAVQPGPVLVAHGDLEPLASYYGEILKAEGLNLYAVADMSQIDAATLAGRKVVILAGAAPSREAFAALRSWTEAGGLLLAMRPGPDILKMMGISRAPSTAPRRRLYMTMGSGEPGGVQPPRLRIHGPVDFYELFEAQTASVSLEAPSPPAVIATLADAEAPLPYPAVVSRRIGQGGAVAFAFDLARSIALTRQGNPTWKDQERDGSKPRRPNDLFFPDYVDIDQLEVPQADEQQRLFANIIDTAAAMPLPRYWYLPQGRKAAVVMVGDDHATPEGTTALFSRLAALSPAGCRLDEWTCLRATSLLTPRKEFAASRAVQFHRLGFEIGLHVDTGCKNLSERKFENSLSEQLRIFRARYPMLGLQSTTRTHCISWNGWVADAAIEQRQGLHLDFNYYHWPPEWLRGRSGFLTGSGFPMPFVTEDGHILDVYQAESHLVNQDGAPQREGVAATLDNALGSPGYYGAFGTHFDYTDHYAAILTDEARKRGVALISGAQLLAWTQARNASSFTDLVWQGGDLSFTQRLAPGAEHATVMLPRMHHGLTLAQVTCAGRPLEVTGRTVMAVDYALFPAVAGSCRARYLKQSG